MASASVGARFRQRKILVKQTLKIFRQSEIPDLDTEDLQRDLQHVETGVEKHEESEVHLQRVMGDAGREKKTKESSKYFIPTPDASKLWAEAKKYYKGHYELPDQYLKTLATVEDTEGIHYCMDEEDEEYLSKLNKSLDLPLSEDEFEALMDLFERVVDKVQPFVRTDPSSIMSFSEMRVHAVQRDPRLRSSVRDALCEELHVSSLPTLSESPPRRRRSELLDFCGEKVYEHWRERRLRREGHLLLPELKFEEPGEKSTDDDPYVCFRRREFRLQRKTRKTDLQSAEKLRRLQAELRSIKTLATLVAQRELRRLELLALEERIFEERCTVKELKRNLGIKGEEEDLVQHKRRKTEEEQLRKREKKQEKEEAEEPSRRVTSVATLSGGSSGMALYVRLPPSKIPDMEMETLEAASAAKRSLIEALVAEKLRLRRTSDLSAWVNLTDDPMSPFFSLAERTGDTVQEHRHLPYLLIVLSLFEVETTNYLPVLVREELRRMRYRHLLVFDSQGKQLVPEGPGKPLMEQDEGAKEEETDEVFGPSRYSPYENESARVLEPVLRMRRRIGRGGRVILDRRGVVGRGAGWFGTEEEDEPEVGAQALAARVQREKRCNVYDSEVDRIVRHESRWRFDLDRSAAMEARFEPFGADPAKLNCILNDTQLIRFGLMLLLKAYDSYREAQSHRQQMVEQARKKMQLMRLQTQQARQQARKPQS